MNRLALFKFTSVNERLLFQMHISKQVVDLAKVLISESSESRLAKNVLLAQEDPYGL